MTNLPKGEKLHRYYPMLYIPATRPDLGSVLRQPSVRCPHSITVCLEDAVDPFDRTDAAKGLAVTLEKLKDEPRSLFVRPADEDLLNRVLDTFPLHRISGIVLPKATVERVNRWVELTSGFIQIVPILESAEALDPIGRTDLGSVCNAHRTSIDFARIGANDLLKLLGGLRRPKGKTIYETPVGRVIDSLLEVFSLIHLPLCGPVFDHFSDTETLARELEEDVSRGLFSKTVIHPSQLETIWNSYRPPIADIQDAMQLLHPDAPAVMSFNGSMLEKACHSDWAMRILLLARLHGIPMDIETGLSDTVLTENKAQRDKITDL